MGLEHAYGPQRMDWRDTRAGRGAAVGGADDGVLVILAASDGESANDGHGLTGRAAAA